MKVGAFSVGFWICMKMIIHYFDLIVCQLTNCSNYVKLFWSDEELFVRSFLCSVPWFVIAETFYHIKDIKCGLLKVLFKSKGQLILKYPFGVFKSTKNQEFFCKDFCTSLLKEAKLKK